LVARRSRRGLGCAPSGDIASRRSRIEFKPNERITVTRDPDYWKAERPYLDGVEYTIIRNLSTATLAFVAGKFDMSFPYSLEVPLLRDVKRQTPEAIYVGRLNWRAEFASDSPLEGSGFEPSVPGR
jgi:hypothetical protein